VKGWGWGSGGFYGCSKRAKLKRSEIASYSGLPQPHTTKRNATSSSEIVLSISPCKHAAMRTGHWNAAQFVLALAYVPLSGNTD
jgi:hypothetical protein